MTWFVMVLPSRVGLPLLLTLAGLGTGCFAEPAGGAEGTMGTATGETGPSGAGSGSLATTGVGSGGASSAGTGTAGSGPGGSGVTTAGSGTAGSSGSSAGTGGGSTGAAGPIDLVPLACLGAWAAGGNPIPCPSEPNVTDPFVRTEAAPALEGQAPTGPAVVGRPAYSGDPVLLGIWPAVPVGVGDVLRATMACGEFETNCEVHWRVTATVDGTTKLLAEGTESHDDAPTPLEVDLSEALGASVELGLMVDPGLAYSGHDVLYLVAPRVGLP